MNNLKFLKETFETQPATQHSLMKPMQSNEKNNQPQGSQRYSMTIKNPLSTKSNEQITKT